MTAAATVNCFGCGRAFEIDLDKLRELVDAGDPPHCGCKPTRPGPHTNKGPTSPRSKADMILITLAAQVRADVGVPTADLVVAVWEENTGAFGLDGYASTYPSDNRVIMELCKMKNHGLVCQPKPKHYAITDAGRAIVARLEGHK